MVQNDALLWIGMSFNVLCPCPGTGLPFRLDFYLHGSGFGNVQFNLAPKVNHDIDGGESHSQSAILSASEVTSWSNSKKGSI